MNIKWEEVAHAPGDCGVHTAVCLNGLIYVGGGNKVMNVYQGSYTINCYDPFINVWDLPIKTPYCYFALTTLNNNLLIVGGRDINNKATNQILTMAPGQLKNYTKMITARSSTTATGHQGMLIVAGGHDSKMKVLSSTELFNSHTRKWCACSDLPIPHNWMKSVIVNDDLYLLGGYDKDNNSSSAVFTTTLDTLLTHQLTWNTYQPTPWCWSAPVSIQGTHLLLVGGTIETEDQGIVSSDIYKLNKVNHSWEAIGHIPLPRESSAAVSIADNEIIVIGGLNDEEEFTNTVWVGSCS